MPLKELREILDSVGMKVIKLKRMVEPEVEDENVDWGEFKTIICVTDDPHFGG